MGCEKIMSRYLASDGNKGLPRDIAEHVARCPRCAREVRNLERAFAGLSREGDEAAGADISAEVLLRIAAKEMPAGGKTAAAPETEERQVSLRKWMGTGIVIILGMVLIPFSTIAADLSRRIGRDFEIYLHLILGLVISTYAAVFIISHMDFLRDYFRLQKAGLRK